MQIRVYTEEAWKAYSHPHVSCYGKCTCPVWITADKVKDLLERASLPGTDDETYIIMSEETIKRNIEKEKEFQEFKKNNSDFGYPYPIYTMGSKKPEG